MWSNELKKKILAFEQFTMLLNINPLKKMFEEIFFFLFMKSEMRKIDPPHPNFFFTSPFPLFQN